MDPKPPIMPIPTPEQGPKILSFEEFSRRDSDDGIPNYNNFFLNFDVGFFADIYRKQKHYKKFAVEYPEIAATLCEKIPKTKSKDLKLLDRNLYEAYKIMRSYGVSDIDLFA